MKKIFVSVLLFLFISLIQSCNNSTPKPTRQEPYTVIEKQEITLTYLIQDKELYYNRVGGAILLNENPKFCVYCTVTNTSDYSGVFKLYAKISSQGNTIEFNKEEFIKSGESKKLYQEKEINPYSFETNVTVDSWGIIAPKKIIDVPVTKYRTVEDNN